MDIIYLRSKEFALLKSSLREKAYIQVLNLSFSFRLILTGPCYKFINMQTTTTLTPSPTKRSNFRSKTKLKQAPSTMESKLKVMPSFYVYLKQFPLDSGQDVIGIVRSFQPTHNAFLQNLQNLKLYKPQLSASLEDNWADFMSILKGVVVRLLRRGDKVLQEKERKINALLQMNRELQNQQQQWKQKIQKIEHLRQLESAQLTMADTQLQIVSSQMRDIYKLLQGDMEKVSIYLSKLEKSRATANQQGSSQIFSSLKTLSLLMNNMENQQRQDQVNLTNMRELIKAMTKCSKVTTGTQVDQSELLTEAGAIFNNAVSELEFGLAEASAVNVQANADGHLIDRLKIREIQNPAENFRLQKHAEKPWTLTPTLLVFLQNMSKNNEAGKVLPWEYTKQVITQIYQQRNAYEGDMAAGGIGNSMQFDQFVVFYFLHKHRIRRLAEVKLLEFIISLKYYSRYWPRAEIFCQLMDVMRYQPLFQNMDGFNYKIDFNTQNFFFAVFKRMMTYKTIDEEGATFIPVKQVKKLMRATLYFTEQVNRSRLLAKLDKGLRVFEKQDHCDFDYALSLFLDEYLSTKKRICTSLTRAFSRKFQQNSGYFSIDQMKQLFSQQSHLYRAGEDLQYRYPIVSDLQIGKLYLFTATAGKNGYDFNVNHFIDSVQRYGFDSPFPFLHQCSKMKKGRQQIKQISIEKTETNKQNTSNLIIKHIEDQRIQEKNESISQNNLAKQRIDIGVKMFSQHFSILREMYSYVEIFSKTLKDEKNPDVLWKNFDQIKIVLQRGCQFMRYPLIDTLKK